jgi:MFS family permease
VLKPTNSGTALSLATALQYLPILFLGPYGGVIADRISKRKILYFTQSISGVLALIMGVLVATGLVKVWMVYILAFCLGMVNVFDNPTRQTFYIELVGLTTSGMPLHCIQPWLIWPVSLYQPSPGC